MFKNIHWIYLLTGIVVFFMYYFAFTHLLHMVRPFLQLAITAGMLTFFLVGWCNSLAIRAYPTSVALMLYTVSVSVVISGSGVVTCWYLLQYFNDKFPTDLKIENEHWYFLLSFSGIINVLLAVSLAMQKKNNILEKKLALQTDASVLVRDAELFKLRQQINPHFLYNSLNSINALIGIKPEQAQDMVGKLSDFLRSSVKRETEDRIPVSEELVYIQSYLDIETIRFGDRLKVVMQIKDKEGAVLPPFLMQPILENAIKYGIYGTVGQVLITIDIKVEYQMLVIKVTNPYDKDQGTRNGTGFGLDSIRRRLFLIYARTDLLETIKDENDFTTILKIPQHV